MNSYVIITDSGCDIKPEILDKWNVKAIDITFKKKDEANVYSNSNMPVSEFYAMMKNGTMFQTSSINLDAYERAFEEELSRGHDVVYIGLSSGLSATIDMARITAQEMMQKYPGQKIAIIDSLCASAGQGLLVYLAVRESACGATFEELTAYIELTIRSVCHWFTVDDLKYLKLGGRVGAAAAFTATVLHIKPIMHLDDDGCIYAVSKTRGRKNAIIELAERYSQLAKQSEQGIYFISHGDCLDDALLLESLIEQKSGRRAELITDIGPVIGAHSGPGTLALFFEGTKR